MSDSGFALSQRLILSLPRSLARYNRRVPLLPTKTALILLGAVRLFLSISP